MRFLRNRVILLLATCGLVLLFGTQGTQAAINPMISFQGKLTNPDGTNVADGNYSIRFRIYTDPSADTGACANTCKWEETHGTVAVSGGIFHVNLGSGGSTLPGSVDFNGNALYLGIKVSTDAEMTPRVRLTAAPYAFNSSLLEGLGASAFVQLSPGAQQTGNINVSGTITSGAVNGITIGNTIQPSANGALTVRSTGSNALNLTGGAASTWDIGNNLLSLQTTNNGAITTGTGLWTQGGNLTFNGTAARTITGPATGGLAVNVTTGPLTLSTTTSGTLAVTSAGALNLSGAAASSINIGSNTLAVTASNFSVSTAGAITAATSTNTINNLVINNGSLTNVGANITASGALTVASGGSSGLTLDSASNTIQIAANDTTIQRAASGTFTLDLNNAAATTLAVTNTNGTGVASLTVEGDITASGIFKQGANNGASTTCSGGQFLQNQVVNGGIVTGGTCATANETLQTAYNNDASGEADITTTSAAKTFLFKAGATFDSATLLHVQNAASVNLFTVDSSNSRVQIGSTTADATPVLLVLDSHASEPTGVNGGSYYNSTSNSIRCYANGAWTDCDSGPIARETTLINIASSTTETDIFNFTVPANKMGTNRMLRLTIVGARLNNSGAAETAPSFRVYTGGTLRYRDAAVALANNASWAPVSIQIYFTMQNSNNTMYMGGFVGSTGVQGGATTGIGNLANGTANRKVQLIGPANGTTFTQSTTANWDLRVTWQNGTSNANNIFRRHYAILEFL